MSLFVGSSAWFAAAYRPDAHNERAKDVLSRGERLVTTDHVLVETWSLLERRLGYAVAEEFWDALRAGVASIQGITAGDLECAWAIGQAFPDQGFSLVDRTCFAAMERLGVTRVATFDDHFAIYRYGRNRTRAFEVVR